MIISKRERYIIAVAVISLAVLALDRYALRPLLNRRLQMQAERENLLLELERSRDLVRRAKQTAPRWKEMTESGMKHDAEAAETQVMHAMRDWAEESGLSLSLLKPDRTAGKTKLPEVAFQAAGSGNMKAVSGFLWRLETARIPLRIQEVQLSSRREGKDDLSLQLCATTLYLPAAEQQLAMAADNSAPKGRPTTQPVPWDRYRVLSERNIFVRDRSIRAETVLAPAKPAAETKEVPRPGMVLTGIVRHGQECVGFFTDGQAVQTIRLSPGCQVAEGKIGSASIDGVEYQSNDNVTTVRVGESLSATTRPATMPASTVADDPNSNDANVLERMRQRRKQEFER